MPVPSGLFAGAARPAGVLLAMRHRAYRLFAIVITAAILAGCDKCADNFLVDPFAKPKPAACHEVPPAR